MSREGGSERAYLFSEREDFEYEYTSRDESPVEDWENRALSIVFEEELHKVIF